MDYLFDPVRASLPIAGERRRFPVHRIFCVGRNYAEHAREMGMKADETEPVFFMKPASAVVENGAEVPYPPMTRLLHHEVELVVAIGAPARDIAPEDAAQVIFGYAVGNDLTRRDLQARMRASGGPWEIAKAFDQAAPVTAVQPAATIGHPRAGRIWLSVNGKLRQQGDIAQMIQPPELLVARLSRFFTLAPGDLVFTGTPAGVGPLAPGDVVEAGVDGIAVLRHSIGN